MNKSPSISLATSDKRQVVFIDTGLPDYQTLIDGLPDGMEVVLVAPDQDGIQIMAEWAETHRDYMAFHVLGHGSEGAQQLGSATLSADSISQYQEHLSQIGSSLTEDGDILLYGCNVAAGETGVKFIGKLAQFTGADIAASNDLTGDVDKGGDWSTEVQSGQIADNIALNLKYESVLAATTLTFSSNDGNWDTDHIAEDGEGGSTDIAGITIQIFNIDDSSGTKTTSMQWFNSTDLASSDGFTGLTVDFNSYFTEWGGVAVKSSDGSEFKFNGFDFYDWGNQTGEAMSLVAYRDGAMVDSSTVSFNANSNTSRVNQDLSANSYYQYVDEVRIYFNDGSGYASINNIIIDDAVAPNTAPTLGGTPADDTAIEDVATAIDLSAYNISDAELDDPITLTLSVDRGTIAALGGNGTASGVTVAGSGTNNMTLAGGEADLNIFLDNTSNILYTTASNDTTAATLTVTPNDGTTDGSVDTVTINISAVNDDPTVTGLVSDITFTEDTQGNVDLSAATFADVDSSNVTVTLTASEGTFATPADGAGVGGGVTETLVNATTITLVGTAADINTYLDTASNIQWTGASNDSGNDASTFTVTVNDGDGSGDVALGTINADITPANDDPTATGLATDLTFSEDTQGNVDLSAVSFADVDSATLTVTLTASEGTFATPADGAGVGGGVTETLVNATTITLVGTAADINTYLDTASNIQWTGASNDSGNDASTFTVTANDGDGSGNVALGSVNADITAANDAPALDAGQSPALTAIDEDAGDDDGSAADGDDDGSNNTNNPGTSVATMVVDGSITDVDGGAVEAIAVTQVDNTNGVWQYSTDNGTSWNNFSGTTGSSVDLTATARLLDGSLSGASTQLVRFVPDTNYSGTATITFRAWDTSAGVAGGTADTSTNGGSSAFSSATDTASVTVNAVNDAPVFSGLDGTPSYTEGAATVQLDANATISDQELDALNGGNGDYSGASLTIARNGGADASDLFSVLTGGSLTVAGGPNGGGTVTAGGNVIATIANTGNGQLQLSFADNGTTPTTALVNEVLQAIRYSNSSNDLAANAQLDYTFSDGAANGTGSITVTLTDVNDAPSVTATGGDPTFIEGGAAQDLYNTVTADTVETGQTFTAMTLTVTNVADGASEILSFDGSDVALTHNNTVTPTATNGLTVGVSVTGSTATVSFSGATLSEAQLQTLVDGLTYRNESQDPTTAGNRVVTITSVTDSGGGTNSATPNLTSTASLTGVNDAPVVSNVYTETSQVVAGNGSQTLSGFADATVTNVDSTDYNGGFITLAQTSGTANGNWLVDGTTVTSGGDASVSAGETIQVSGTSIGTVDVTDDGQGGNDFTINFSANTSNSAVQSLLHNLQYEAPSALGDRDFTLTLNDADGIANGGDADDSGSFTISVTPNPPVIGNLDSDSVNASEGGGTVLLDAGSNATLTDADSANFNGGTLTVTVSANADAASDVLSVDTSGVVSLAGVTAGSNVSVSGTVVGTLGNNIAAGNDFVVNLNANATPALTQSLLRALTFEATGESPAESTRTVNITVSDGQGSGSANVSVVVTAVNDAPQLAGLISDVSFTEDTAANLDLSAATLSDVDTTGNVTLTLTASAGTLAATSGGGVTIGGSASAALTLTGTIADIDSYLNGANITHTPGENLAGTDAATVSLSINDGGTDTNLGSVNIDITPVNDAPTAADDTVNISYNGTHTFTAADFGFSDVDSGDSLQSVRIDTVPAEGTLTLNGNAVSNGDIISIADIDASLLQFSPTSGESGAGYATLQFTVNDGTVFAGASNTLTFDVSAAPPPPPPTPEPEPEPEPAPNLIDGATVDESNATENGQQVAKITISPITSDREDSDSNTSLADIPLHFDENNEPVTTLSLPVGIGATARSNETAIDQTSFRDGLYLLRDSAPASDWFSMINGMDQWLNGIGAGWLNQVTFTSNSSEAPSEPIKVSGVAGDKTEVMVIDASQLPAGTVIDLDNIEFAIIVGDVQVRGGSGSNVVFAGSGNQNIVLGEDDDELHGGDGDDTVGSEGGDDLLFGENGNDTLFGGAGKDQLHGGMDNDIATYEGNFADYRVEQLHGVVTITHLDDETDVDTLINIEQIQFADQNWNPVYSTDLSIIATLYQQVLDRQADLGGFQYWSSTADSRSKGQIALEFLTSDEYQQENSFAFDQLSLAEQIEQLYQGLLGRSSDLAGKEYWSEQLAEGMDLSQVAEGFVYSDELNGQLKASNSWDFFL